MKNNYLFLFLALFLLKATTGFCTKHTVSATNSQFVFSSDSVSANVGDTIDFVLGSLHSALEVSQSTWNANGNTALGGGFHAAFGGGEVVVTQAKVYYYVCENHYTMGMKGRIFVTNPSGVKTLASPSVPSLDVYPNPFNAGTTLNINLPSGKTNTLRIYDFLGRCLYEKQDVTPLQYLDLSEFSSGTYLLSLRSEDILLAKKIIITK